MAFRELFILLGVVFSAQLCCGQSAIVQQNIIEIFGAPAPLNTDTPPSTTTPLTLLTGEGEYLSCGEFQECVPRHLCVNGSISQSGEVVIKIKVGGAGECPYLEECCNIPNRVTVSVVKPKPATALRDCGYRNTKGVGYRISGGTDNETEFGEFPWMVAVMREENSVDGILTLYECGGALIAPDVVITAAHCVQKYMPDPRLLVRAGEWDTQTISEVLPHQDRRVKEVIVHEKFHKGALWYDIALLFLETPVEIAENVRPVCLPPANAIFDYQRCIATGWGQDTFGKGGKFMVILKKVELPIIPHNQCQVLFRRTTLGRYFLLDNSFICAGGEKGKDTCKGDGGSPLVCPIISQPSQYYHAGIVAWGLECGEENVPGAYTNVAYLRTWIDDHLANRSIDSSLYTPILPL